MTISLTSRERRKREAIRLWYRGKTRDEIAREFFGQFVGGDFEFWRGLVGDLLREHLREIDRLVRREKGGKK